MYHYCERCDRQGKGISYGHKTTCPFCNGKGWQKIYDYDWKMSDRKFGEKKWKK